MEHFDDMLRNTLANDYPENRFEFREEYWLQAQALIESYERKRKRRTIFWIFTGLLLTTAAVWYFYDGSTPESATPDAQPAVQQYQQQPMAAREATSPGAPGAHQSTSQSSATAADAAPSTSSATALTKTNNTFNNNKPTNNTTVSERTNNNSIVNNTSAATTTGSSQKTALQTPQPGLQPDAGISSPEQPGAVNTAAAPGRGKMYSAKTIESPGFQPVNSLLPAQRPVLAMRQPSSTDAVADVSTITQKAHEHKWHAGLTILAGNSTKNLRAEGFSMAFGFTNQFKINQKWSVNADLLWRRRNAPSDLEIISLPGGNVNTDAVIFNEQSITYSFGYNLTQTITILDAIHFAELPVYVSRHFGKWTIDAGGMITTPLLFKTYTQRNESSTLNKTGTITGEATKYQSNTDQIRNSIIPGLVAGVNYEPFRNLSVGLRGTYNLAQNDYNLSFSSEAVEPVNINRSLSPFSADLRVKWLF